MKSCDKCRHWYSEDVCEYCASESIESDCSSPFEHELQLANEKIERLERLLGYALTVERNNTAEWMVRFLGEANKVLVADGDHRRAVYDGNKLFLRSIHQVR